VASQKNGIKQTYWFQLGDQADPNEQFSQMGLYYFFGDKSPYNATPTDQGIALKTTSDLLYGKTYDAQRTAALNLPPAIDGAAFKDSTGTYTYVLWAKTTTDMSETASASYSFPKDIIQTNNVLRKKWNYSETDTASVIDKKNITLFATPSLFSETAATISRNPMANAGEDRNILSATNSIVLSGKVTATEGKIKSFDWSQRAGPSHASIESPNQLKTVIKNLEHGIYVFRLTVTDEKGAKGIDDIAINTPVVLPAKIEAEKWIGMSGVKTENTPDVGGGLNVGWIDAGDWMNYSFFVPETAIYTFDIRVATPNNGGQLQIKNENGIVLATVQIPNTGAYQKWQTVQTSLKLDKGMQTIKLQSLTAPVWNFNWMELKLK
jgi:hypothetical protein